MTEYRYCRMADNNQGWRRPHGGRMGGDDYVGQQGLGGEDWNFANDVWKDGRYHLYLRQTPAGFENGTKFNFVLGAHAKPVPIIIGFVENATHGISELPEEVWLRRAQEVFALNETNDLGPFYRNLSVEKLVERFKTEANAYKISVAPEDLHILAQPASMPSDIYKVSHPGYRALHMDGTQYDLLKERVLSEDIKTSVDQEEEVSFPEGHLVEKLHRSRERSRRLVKKAKEKFIRGKGGLFCEACKLVPEEHFKSNELCNRIIEAHHDIPLSDERHAGETKVTDLRMLCPSCHRAIHVIRPWLTVKEFRKRFK